MGFFSGYGRGHSPMMALAGLGKLTRGKTAAPSKEATRVVNAFVRGEIAAGSCSGPAEDRSCEIVSDGRNLTVGNTKLASRNPRSPDEVSVCVPAHGQMITPVQEGKKPQEAQNSKDMRASASALMRVIGAGIGIKQDPYGARRFTGSKGRARLMVPDVSGCFKLKLDQNQKRAAREGTAASMRAQQVYSKLVPTKREIEKQRKEIKKELQAMRLERARAARAARAALVAPAAFGPTGPSGRMKPTAADKRAFEQAAMMQTSSPFGPLLPSGSMAPSYEDTRILAAARKASQRAAGPIWSGTGAEWAAEQAAKRSKAAKKAAATRRRNAKKAAKKGKK